jgi:hypothetical protein
MIPKSANRLSLAAFINKNGVLALIPCDRCALRGLVCVSMENRPKCSECTRLGRPCVGLSLESLNRTCDKLEDELGAALDEHEKLVGKINRLRKTLRYNKSLQNTKASCVAQELADDNDGVEDENPSTMSQLVDSMPSSFWDSILAPPQNVEASSRSS